MVNSTNHGRSLSSRFRRTMLVSTTLSSVCFAAVAAAASFDYIVVGGGTGGLVVANRLSENSDSSVLIIERGDTQLDNPDVYDPNSYGAAFGSSIDYAYQSVPQQHAGGNARTLRAGKALGGTSTINGMAYTSAQDVQIDAWGEMGNEGWSWSSLFPYYLKSEDFQVPTPAQYDAGANYVASYNGESGPLLTGWTYNMQNSSIHTELNETYLALGIDYVLDVNGGKMHGYSMFPRTVDRAENVREDAARAYYYPFEDRPNLFVMLNTTGNRIVWAPASNTGNAVATGVEVTHSDGTVENITALQEVILSAGSLISPAILERSGVGNPE